MGPVEAALPGALSDWGPARLAAVVIAVYLVVGEPFVGHTLHRRFEARLGDDPGARRSLYRRLLVLEWGLASIALVVWLAAPDVTARQVGLAWPQQWPGLLTTIACLLLLALVVFSTLTLRSGALAGPPAPGGPAPDRPAPDGSAPGPPAPGRPGEGRTGEGRPGDGRPAEGRPAERRHAEPPGAATVALLPRSPLERRLFAVVGVTAGVCEEWLYRGFFLAVVAAVAPGLPGALLVLVAAVAFGVAHAYQGLPGVLTTGVLGGVLAAVYLSSGSLLLPVLLHVLIDLRFLLVPASALPAVAR